MRCKRWATLWALAVCVVMGSFPIPAQTTNGSLQGKVTDEAGQPVAGALIEVRGPALQAYLGTATDLGGQYNFPFVPVGTDYEVKVETSGFNTVVRKDIGIRLGTTVILPFVLGQGKTEVVVTAAAPLVDTRKTEVGANISNLMINAIPLERNADGIAYLAPGAVPSGLVLTTPPSAGPQGQRMLTWSTAWTRRCPATASNQGSLNFDFVEAVEVKTGGVDAEYGAFMGGLINSITKSGGNEFHGSLFAYYFDDGLGAVERPVDYPGITRSPMSFKQYDVGGTLGGYFIKDKLWFFAAYDYNKTETGYYGEDGGDAFVSLNGHPATSWGRGQSYTDTETNPPVRI